MRRLLHRSFCGSCFLHHLSFRRVNKEAERRIEATLSNHFAFVQSERYPNLIVKIVLSTICFSRFYQMLLLSFSQFQTVEYVSSLCDERCSNIIFMIDDLEWYCFLKCRYLNLFTCFSKPHMKIRKKNKQINIYHCMYACVCMYVCNCIHL